MIPRQWKVQVAFGRGDWPEHRRQRALRGLAKVAEVEVTERHVFDGFGIRWTVSSRTGAVLPMALSAEIATRLLGKTTGKGRDMDAELGRRKRGGRR